MLKSGPHPGLQQKQPPASHSRGRSLTLAPTWQVGKVDVHRSRERQSTLTGCSGTPLSTNQWAKQPNACTPSGCSLHTASCNLHVCPRFQSSWPSCMRQSSTTNAALYCHHCTPSSHHAETRSAKRPPMHNATPSVHQHSTLLHPTPSPVPAGYNSRYGLSETSNCRQNLLVSDASIQRDRVSCRQTMPVVVCVIRTIQWVVAQLPGLRSCTTPC